MTTDLTSGLDTAAFSSVIKPSDDLFRFVNGPWIDTYRLPDDKARYGSFDKLAEDAESQIRDILEDEDCPAAKSQALYRSFMDTDAIEAAGATPIRPALDAIDHAADKAALTRTIGALKPIDMGPDVFDIAVFGDPKNPDTNVVHLEQSGIGLPDEAYYREDHYAPIREAYVDMVAKQLRLAGYGDEETTRAQADRFLDVETRIAANHWDNDATRDSQKTSNPTDFVTLSEELRCSTPSSTSPASSRASTPSGTTLTLTTSSCGPACTSSSAPRACSATTTTSPTSTSTAKCCPAPPSSATAGVAVSPWSTAFAARTSAANTSSVTSPKAPSSVWGSWSTT